MKLSRRLRKLAFIISNLDIDWSEVDFSPRIDKSKDKVNQAIVNWLKRYDAIDDVVKEAPDAGVMKLKPNSSSSEVKNLTQDMSDFLESKGLWGYFTWETGGRVKNRPFDKDLTQSEIRSILDDGHLKWDLI